MDPSIAANDSDAFSVEEKGEVKIDLLPWSGISEAPETWIRPHICDTPCWHQNPVEVAACRYEWAGRFEEASKLRADFIGLSTLHHRVLQWYIWSEGKLALNG